VDELSDFITIVDVHNLYYHNNDYPTRDPKLLSLWREKNLSLSFSFLNRNIYELFYKLEHHKEELDFYSTREILQCMCRLTCYADYNLMSKLLQDFSLVGDKNFLEFQKKKENLNYIKNSELLISRLTRSEDIKSDCINSDNLVFLVKDKDAFLNNLRNNNLSVNRGPQSSRGVINYQKHFLVSLDTDFRRSLYNHYIQHSHEFDEQVYKSTGKKVLKQNKFNFKNVHSYSGNIY